MRQAAWGQRARLESLAWLESLAQPARLGPLVRREIAAMQARRGRQGPPEPLDRKDRREVRLPRRHPHPT